MLITYCRLFLASGLLGLLASCASSNPHTANRLALEGAHNQIKAGDLDGAKTALEALVVSTNDSPGEFALQRYFAAYLLSRASLEASLHARGDDWLSPLIASSYYLNFAHAWSKAAAASPPTAGENEAQLPETLAAYGVDKAQAYLDVTWLVLCSRTGFQGVAEIIGREPRLLTVKGAEELCAAVDVSEDMQPWLMWCLFDFQKTRNEQLAYQFGVRARELGRNVPQRFPAARGEQIVNWILNESKFVFKSSGNIEFDPGADMCSETGEANIRFKGQRK